MDAIPAQHGSGRPFVRAARADDLEAMVAVEFAAFGDAYECPRSEQTTTAVRQKFGERLELLGRWARVLVVPSGEVVGMSLAYPIRIGRSELIELGGQGRNLADTAAIREYLDPRGTALWGLSLGVAPSSPVLTGMALLARSMRSLRLAHGIERSFFASRLPGLARWAAVQVPGQEPAELPRERQHELAVRYFDTTVQRDGGSRRGDSLLAMYMDAGAVPIGLFSHWPRGRPERGYIDMPSLGYHVLCERAALSYHI